MSVTQQILESTAHDNFEGRWELHDGKLREKPVMSHVHNEVMFELGHQIRVQLDPDVYLVRANMGRLRLASDTAYIPDVFVVPRSAVDEQGADSPSLEMFSVPALLVVEVWSPSTSQYDIDQKIPRYAMHGDQEIWRVDPRNHPIEVWVRAKDGSYDHRVQQGGTLTPAWLPGVRIDFDPIFKRAGRGGK